MSPNHLAQTIQRHGASGTEEDWEALIYLVVNEALERAAERVAHLPNTAMAAMASRMIREMKRKQ